MSLLIFAGIAALVGGLVNAGIGIWANSEEQARLKEQQTADEEAFTADQASNDAQWQLDMQNAQRQVEDIGVQRAELIRQSDRQFELSKNNLETTFGSDASGMGTVWNDYAKNLIAGESSKSSLLASAGASGLKNSGTVRGMGLVLDQAVDADVTAQQRDIMGQQQSAIGGVAEDYSRAQFTINQATSDANRIKEDWGQDVDVATFDWGRFTQDPTPSRLQNIYKTKKTASDEAYDLTELKYKYALKDSDPMNFMNWGTDFLNGAGMGMDLFGKAYSFGLIGSGKKGATA